MANNSEFLASVADRLGTDLRSAFRGLRGGRGATLFALIVLSMALAAAIITFSVVDALLLRALPFKDPAGLIAISVQSGATGGPNLVSPADYYEWRQRTRAFQSIAAARRSPALILEVNGGTQAITTVQASPNLFATLGIRPALGTFFDGAEPSTEPFAVVLSHSLWSQAFRADAGAIGQTLVIDGKPRRIIGVAPADAWFPVTPDLPPDAYLPYIETAADQSNTRAYSFHVVGRLGSGVSIDGARADLARIASLPIVVETLRDHVVGDTKRPLLLVLAAVGCVLLVACANAGIMQLARTTTRLQEFALRRVLGASRVRLTGQLLCEGTLLSVAAVTIGVSVSMLVLRVVKENLPASLGRQTTISIDLRVIAVSAALALVCGVITAIAPAAFASRNDGTRFIRRGEASIVDGRKPHRTLGAFLVLDISLVTALLVAAGLVTTTFLLLSATDLGFERRNVLVMSYQRWLTDLPAADRGVASITLRNSLLARLQAVPGVSGVAILAGSAAPLSGGGVRYGLTVPGLGDVPREDWPETRLVTPDYFSVMGIRLVRGRLLTEIDRLGTDRVIIINDVAARRFFKGQDPLGQVVTLNGPATIVGIVAGTLFQGPEASARSEVYLAIDQESPARQALPLTGGMVVARTANRSQSLISDLRRASQSVVAPKETTDPHWMDDDFRRVTASRRFNAQIMSIFGVIALAIAAIGVYATTSFFVTQQTRSIGLRLALGATKQQVRWMVVGRALGWVLSGAITGLLLARLIATALKPFTAGIGPKDPAAYLATAVFIAGVGVIAAIVPAIRASRLDPLVALRRE